MAANDEVKAFLAHFKISKFEAELKSAGVEALGDLKELDDGDINDLSTEMESMGKIHAKKFFKAVKAFQSGAYPPKQENVKNDMDEIDSFLGHYKLLKYSVLLKEAGLESLKEIKELDNNDLGDLAAEANMNTLHKKKFIKACKAVKDGEYKPQNTGKGTGNDEIDIFLKQHDLQQYSESLKQNGLTKLSDIKQLNDNDIKEIAKECGLKVLHRKRFLEACNKYKGNGGSNNKKNDEEEKIQSNEPINIQEWLGTNDKPSKNDKLVKCGACNGGGWFTASEPCLKNDSYAKAQCTCCNGIGKMPDDYKQCWRCTGKGYFSSSEAVFVGDSYKKCACPLCGGKCYFSSNKYNALRRNKNKKCGVCSFLGSFTSSEACIRGDSYFKSECAACDGTLYINDDYSKCGPCDAKGYFTSSEPCIITDSYKKATCPSCHGKAYRSLKGLQLCSPCQGKGSFTSSEPCIISDSYRKTNCTCCDGQCYISVSRKNKCQPCNGYGHFTSSEPCTPADSYKRRTCTDCKGKCWV